MSKLIIIVFSLQILPCQNLNSTKNNQNVILLLIYFWGDNNDYYNERLSSQEHVQVIRFIKF